MPPDTILDDEDYGHSSDDSDFAPDALPAEGEDESSDEDSEPAEALTVKKGKPRSTKRKRGQDDEAEDAGFENSGDEAIIEKGLKKQKKKNKEADEVEGGEGGLIKTRSMRALEKTEKRLHVDISAATVDVDALWAEMTSGKTKPKRSENDLSGTVDMPIGSQGSLSPKSSRNGVPSKDVLKEAPSTMDNEPDSMIMIKRTYNFAGQVHTEQKLVPRDSAEAKLFLASQDAVVDPLEGDSSLLLVKPKRPTKKARRSVFEPLIELPRRTDLHFGIRKDTGIEITALGKDAKKLNTVEKSAMDWAGFVDKEGIKDDLTAASKSRGAYKARQEFLARVEQKKDEEARRARGLV
ncbi:hypothetical protein OIDMADRAFT_141620 [Oidiodendron maius Zn]|uniref:SWR1-complex protein 5 n=1 Tax=Oidiodendron maius (strain Zn) TaxID=913774 RepID=A0A0C3HSG1_OIDMZ|nr:hypothetical protein OIDMADRAFT_141620 [Oidiodendron maius Zn]